LSIGRTKSRYTSVILLITHSTCLERARVRVRVQTVFKALRILAYPKWPLRSPWRSSTRRARCAFGTCRVVTGCDGTCARNRREITRGRSNASHSITELRPPLTDDSSRPTPGAGCGQDELRLCALGRPNPAPSDSLRGSRRFRIRRQAIGRAPARHHWTQLGAKEARPGVIGRHDPCGFV